jgi:hypothetical protein
MKSNISSQCADCGGEDCVCCEIYVEQQRDSYYTEDSNYMDAYYESVNYYGEEYVDYEE